MKTSPSLYVHFMQQIHGKGNKDEVETCRFCFSDRLPKAIVKTVGKKKKFSFHCKVCRKTDNSLSGEIVLDGKKQKQPELFEINREPVKDEEEIREKRENRKKRRKIKQANSGLIIPQEIFKPKSEGFLSAKKDSAKVLSIAKNPEFLKMLSKLRPECSNSKLNNFLLQK